MVKVRKILIIPLLSSYLFALCGCSNGPKSQGHSNTRKGFVPIVTQYTTSLLDSVDQLWFGLALLLDTAPNSGEHHHAYQEKLQDGFSDSSNGSIMFATSPNSPLSCHSIPKPQTGGGSDVARSHHPHLCWQNVCRRTGKRNIGHRMIPILCPRYWQ